MTEQTSSLNSIVQKRIEFFEKESEYFLVLKKNASEMAVQNVPVFVLSEDFILRRWFAQLLCFCKFKNVSSFFVIQCSETDSLQKLENIPDFSVVFLDEIEKSLSEFQKKLLSYFENAVFEKKNIKIVAGSVCGLEQKCETGEFLKNLAFRFSLLKVRVPNLNENRSEIIPLAKYFLLGAQTECGKKIMGFSEEAQKILVSHYWRGNSLELKNAVERAVILGEGEYITADDFYFEDSKKNKTNRTENGNQTDDLGFTADSFENTKTLKEAVESFKKFYVRKILEENGNNQTKAAKVLDIQRTYVSRLITELNIR